MAQAPNYYVSGYNADGSAIIDPVPVTLQELYTKGAAGAEVVENGEGQTKQLNTTANQNWYWAGGDEEVAAEGTETNNGISISGLSVTDGAHGDINIVVGPNGGPNEPALTVESGFTIPSGVMVNIYQAANAPGTTQPKLDACFMQIEGTQATAAQANIALAAEAAAAQVGITIDNGGTLNVVSGAICGAGGAAAAPAAKDGEVSTAAQTGLLINGTAKITGGQLQGIAGGEDVAGITIGTTTGNVGSLQANGGLVYAAGVDSTEKTPVAGSISGLSGLTVDGATINTTDDYVASANLKNGVWGQITNNKFNYTAFGTSSLSTGLFGGMVFADGEALTILNNANLTIPNNANLTFQGSSSTATSTLTIDESGTLTIAPNANVNMNTNSVLNNSGTIDVETAQ